MQKCANMKPVRQKMKPVQYAQVSYFAHFRDCYFNFEINGYSFFLIYTFFFFWGGGGCMGYDVCDIGKFYL